jgi:pyrimidine operon attenuation protein/uracil phosphoribosyltransferase
MPVQQVFSKSITDKKRFEIVIRNSLKAPLKIVKFKIKDKGINKLGLKDIANQFYVKVKNQSQRSILAYKLKVKEYTPFQDDSVKEIIITSTKKIKPRKTDKAYQERMINFHLETLYIILVEEVLFEDGTVWSADNGIIKPQGNAGK